MNRRSELRIVRPLVPAPPREEIDDSIEQLVADRSGRRGELPDRAPLDYVDIGQRDKPAALLSFTEWLLLAFITAAGVVGVWIGWPS